MKNTKTAALKLIDVTFGFEKTGNPFFESINLSFTPQKIHFIRGKNGSGKSTLFRILRGDIALYELSSGKIEIDGIIMPLIPNSDTERENRAKIKLVQQKFDLMIADQFSFIDNLRLANMPRFPPIELMPDHQPIPDLIKRFNINFDQPVNLLSGGQRQILAILMALQKATKVLLLDEPTAALDEKNTAMVMDFLQEIVAAIGITILIICHDKELVESYSRDLYYEINVDDETLKRTILYKKLV